MAKKFCRIIENEAGEQLLLRLQPSDEDSDKADFVFDFQMGLDEVVSSITLGGIDWDAAEEMIEAYKEEDGLRILADPMKFVTSITGFYSEEN